MSRCQCTAAAGRSEYSRSECSGRLFRLRRQADRAGGETRRWPSLQPSALCIAALGGRSSGSTQAATDSGKEEEGEN